MSKEQISQLISEAKTPEREAPILLRRKSAAIEPYPVEALGSNLSKAAKAIQDKIQAPLEMCAQSVLATTSLAVQGHADVMLPMGQKRTISLYCLSVAESGERKTSVDKEAMISIKEKVKSLRESYEIGKLDYEVKHSVWKKNRKTIIDDKNLKGNPAALSTQLTALGVSPLPPLFPLLTCGEPTAEGLFKTMHQGQPSMGIYSAEGGQFLNGHSMKEENKVKTAAFLCKLWDDDSDDRIRAGADFLVLSGRRLSTHLMVQPVVVTASISDQILIRQGFWSRFLVVAPPTTSGTRFHKEVHPHTEQILREHHYRLSKILNVPLPLAEGKRNELDPPVIILTEEAKEMWRGFADHTERSLIPGGYLEPITAFANKMPEHAARIACVLALYDDIGVRELTAEQLRRGIALTEYYAAVHLKLANDCYIPEDILLAEKLLSWLQRYPSDIISLPDIYQNVRGVKTKEAAQKIVSILESHGWVIKIKGEEVVSGKKRRDVWRITKADTTSLDTLDALLIENSNFKEALFPRFNPLHRQTLDDLDTLDGVDGKILTSTQSPPTRERKVF